MNDTLSCDFTQDQDLPQIQNSLIKNIMSGHSHSFDTGVAHYFNSIDIAVVFNHVLFWLRHNKADEINQINGKTWMYSTSSQIAKRIGYLNENQIKKNLHTLCESGFLLKENFNRTTFDKTPWFSVPDESLLLDSKNINERQKCPIDKTKISVDGTKMSHRKDLNVRASYIEDIEEDKEIELAQSPKSALHVILFSFEKGKFENITSQEIDSWKELYSECNILLEIKKMEEWCLSNPSKSKGKKLWRKFITTWLQKNHEEITNKQAYQSKSKKTDSNFESVSKKFENSKIYLGAECFLDEEGIAFQRGITHMQVKFKEFGFKDKFDSMIRKFGLEKVKGKDEN